MLLSYTILYYSRSIVLDTYLTLLYTAMYTFVYITISIIIAIVVNL